MHRLIGHHQYFHCYPLTKIFRRTWIARKADSTQECHLFISTKVAALTSFVKPCDLLNLAIQNICYVKLNVESAFLYNLGSTRFSCIKYRRNRYTKKYHKTLFYNARPWWAEI